MSTITFDWSAEIGGTTTLNTSEFVDDARLSFDIPDDVEPTEDQLREVARLRVRENPGEYIDITWDNESEHIMIV